jgi:SAM-dependent methyltransferase
MFEPNVQRLLNELGPDDVVLDVGGWACPFNRAQWVLDSEPFETRGFYRTFGGKASQGGDRERFSRETWVQRDICDRAPWPFADNQFDFAVCSHTLEDVRDPLWVCSELCRVARRGYIEVPSRAFESTRGIERPGMAGLSHHRWLIEITDGEICFLQKLHMINAHWRFALPPSFGRHLTEEKAVQWLWWEGSFRFREETIHGLEAQENALEEFVRSVRPHSSWKLASSRRLEAFAGAVRRAGSWVARRAWFGAVSGARQ